MNHRPRSWLDRLAPPLTLRRQFLRLVKHARHVRASEGPAAARLLWRRALDRFRRTGTLFVAAPPIALPDGYAEWIALRETPTPGPRALPYQPVISILTPVFNTPLDVLAAAIESVRRQTYARWTLCLVNGGSTRPELRELLEHHAAQDARIRVLHLDANLGISGNSNAGLRIADGEFVSLLDHDDLLAADMLEQVVDMLNRHPEADIVYFDEDKISADGATRSSPWFKPSWSPALLFSTNVLMHSVIRRTLIEAVHGFDPVMDGAQDWDLALRCNLRTQNIRHIPRILYHWRQIEGSVALDANAKPWAYDAQARCIGAHLDRLDATGAAVTFPSLGAVRIHWPVGGVRISIVIPTRDNVDLLRACVTSIREKSTYQNYELVIVDTGSVEEATRGYYATLRDDRRVRLVDYTESCPGPFNYSRANNLGAAHATGAVLLFLNNDTEVLEPSWLEDMAGWALRPGVGIVGAKLLRPDGTIQHAGIVMGLGGHGSHIFEGCPEHDYGPFGSPEWVRNYQAVTGACMMMRRAVFDELGGFDEIYQIGYSDIELCLRAGDKAYQVVYSPYARVLHHEGASRGYHMPGSDVIRASCQMIHRVGEGDPYFNPNLSYFERKPTLAGRADPPPPANIVRVLEVFDLVPAGASARPDAIVNALAPPAVWPARGADSTPSHRPRLLLVSHDLSLSGAPLMQAQLAGRLTAAGYEVTAVSPEDGPVREIYSAGNARVVVREELGHMMVNVAPLTDLVAAHDLVIANTLVNWRAVHAASAFGKPSLLWIHESGYGRDLTRVHPLAATALAQADHVVMPAEAQVPLYRDLLIDGRYSVVPYGLELADLEGGDLRRPPANGPLRVVHVGSVEPRKGQDLLLHALETMTPAQRDALEVNLVGRPLDPAFTAALMARARPMANIRFVGEANRAQVLDHIRAADIFVLSSRDEVLPISILEAMSYGKAVVATNVGGVAEMIEDGVNGILVQPGDPAGLAEAIVRCAGNSSLRETLGRNAHATFLRRHTAERFAESFVSLIRQLLAARSRDRPAISHPVGEPL